MMLYHAGNLLEKIISAIHQSIAAHVENSKEEVLLGAELILFILTELISNHQIDFILQNLKQRSQKKFDSMEVECSVVTFYMAFQNKKNIITKKEKSIQQELHLFKLQSNHKEYALRMQAIQIANQLKQLNGISFEDAILKLDINFLILQAIEIEQQMRFIGKNISYYEKNLQARLDATNGLEKTKILRQTLSAIASFKAGDTALPSFLAEIKNQYTSARTLPHTSYTGYALSFIGKYTATAKLLYQLDAMLTQSLCHIETALKSCEKKPILARPNIRP
jgi:hypothetical protein